MSETARIDKNKYQMLKDWYQNEYNARYEERTEAWRDVIKIISDNSLEIFVHTHITGQTEKSERAVELSFPFGTVFPLSFLNTDSYKIEFAKPEFTRLNVRIHDRSFPFKFSGGDSGGLLSVEGKHLLLALGTVNSKETSGGSALENLPKAKPVVRKPAGSGDSAEKRETLSARQGC